MHVHTHAGTQTLIRARYMHARVHACARVHHGTCARVHACAARVHAHNHKYTHIYTCTYTHAYKYIRHAYNACNYIDYTRALDMYTFTHTVTLTRTHKYKSNELVSQLVRSA